MPKKKLPYREGDWFVVPLLDGSHALGLAARMDNRGSVLGYFFPPRYQAPPQLSAANGLRAQDAILVACFGDLDLIERSWPVLGALPGWKREDWPVPLFGRMDVTDKHLAWRAQYDDDTLTIVQEERVAPIDVLGLPEDSFFGAGAIQIHLTNLLATPGDLRRPTLVQGHQRLAKQTDPSPPEEQALRIQIKLSDDKYGTDAERAAIEGLEDVLTTEANESGLGEFDGNEVGMGYYTLFLYGPSAERLADFAIPFVRRHVRLLPGSFYVTRRGAPGSNEKKTAF